MSLILVRWLMRWAETIGRAQAEPWERGDAID